MTNEFNDPKGTPNPKAAEPAAADENKLIAERRAKLAALRAAGQPFPNDYRRDALAGELHAAFADRDAAWLEANPTRVNVGAFDLNSGFFAAIDAVIIFCGMTTVTLTPEQDRFATEAVAQGRFRDVNEVVKASLDLLRDAETERVAFLASLKEAEAESEQHGVVYPSRPPLILGEWLKNSPPKLRERCPSAG